jgi:transposase
MLCRLPTPARFVLAVVVAKGLSVGWHSCPECGARLQRDHNAALNMLALGKRHSAVGQTAQARTWPVGASVV